MPSELKAPDGLSSQAFEPILLGALNRLRTQLPAKVALAVELSHEDTMVRADVQQLEDALFEACLVAAESIAGSDAQIVVQMRDVLLDDVVLAHDAEKLQGGMPPRRYVWLVVSNSARVSTGPFHTLMPAAVTGGKSAAGARMPLEDVRDTIARHLGSMTVSQQSGLGTEFEIFLPAAAPLETLVIGAGAGVKHVFYVDDYEPMRDLVGEMFPDAGFRVTCHESGKDAITALQADPSACDAIVSDFRLQGFSGLELLRQVKQLRPDLPVIIISGYVDEALRTQAQASGAAMVVSKNHDLGELSAALRKLLGDTPDPSVTTYSDWASL
jgi:CheY-like chemotaxis protein